MLGYLKRRFSSGDLQGEAADTREQEGLPAFLNPFNTTNNSSSNQVPLRTAPTQQSRQGINPNNPQGSNTNTNSYKPKAAYPSAPTSPTKSNILPSSFNRPAVDSITGQISSTLTRGIFGAASSNAASNAVSGASAAMKSMLPKGGKCKTILIIDDPHIDWSKYFRGRRVFGDWEFRVEQCQFSELNLVGYSADQGSCTVDVQTDKSGTKSMRSFRPDFAVVRQSSNDSAEDHKNLVMGLLYSGLPALNSLHAVFNMHERVWMFAHLELVRNRLGREVFPLIEQTYYPSYKEMVVPTKFPMVIKIGNCRNGKGKIKVDNHHDFQDIASIVAVSKTYATSEPFIDAKCDLIIQKIGTNFKSFQRKSLSGSWKMNTGSAILEQVPMNDRFRLWITEVSKLFGGLDMCCLKVIQSKSDEYFIYELKGSNMTLLGDSQEEDRKQISELIMSKVQIFCRPNLPKAESLHAINNTSAAPTQPVSNIQRAPPQQQQQQNTSASSMQGSQQPTAAVPSNISNSGPVNMTRPGPGMTQPTAGNVGVTASAGPYMAQTAANTGGVGGSGPQQMTGPSAVNMRDPSGQPMSRQQQLHQQMMDRGGQPIDGAPRQTVGQSTGPPPAMSSGASHQQQPTGSGPPSRPNIPPRQTSLRSNASVEDSDDTMKNLRKTFAGIFGDM